MSLLQFDDYASQFAKVTWRLVRSNVTNTSPLSGNTQRIDFYSPRWAATVEMPIKTGEDASKLQSLLAQLSEPDAWVQVQDYGYVLQGSGGTPLVNGASQTGRTLNLDGFPVSTTGVLKAGDRIGLATGQVVVVNADVDSNASGEVAVSITPALRESPANDSAAEITAPEIIARLANPDEVSWNVAPAQLHTFTFELIEDLSSGAPSPV